MFCRATFTIATLTGTKDGVTEPVNVYDYLSPGSFILAPPTVPGDSHPPHPHRRYDRYDRYDRVDGYGRVLSSRGEQHVDVWNSHVVL